MTAEQLQLITAAVDGELSAGEQRAFRALLASSHDARALFDRLQRDSARIRTLPPVAPPVDLLARIMARVSSSAPLAEPAPARDRGRRLVWAPAAVAAGILVVATATLLGFLASGHPSDSPARNDWATMLPSPLYSAAPALSPNAPPDRAGTAAVGRPAASPVPAPREARPPSVASAPEPRPVRPDLIGSPLLPKLPPFERIDIRVPFLRPATDLGREDVGSELLDELRRDPAFRFDVFARDTARGVDVFQNAARAAGLSVYADAATLDRLKKRQVQAAVIYTESLSATELVALFAHLPAENAKFSPRVCEALHATPVARADEQELKAVFGTDVGLFKRAAHVPAAPERPAQSRPVSADTIDSVVKSVGGPAGKGPDRTAVLLTWQPAPGGSRTNPSSSVELKYYLQNRGDRKPTAVPAVIVIRPAG